MYDLLYKIMSKSHLNYARNNSLFLISRLLCHQNCCLRNFSAHSTSSKNHYEVLGLEKTCSQSDIKSAFLRLSKELHPDMQHPSQSGKQHSKFVRLNTAYTALNKPHSRRLYDAALVAAVRRQQAMHGDGINSDIPDGRVMYPDPSFWAYRDAGQGSANDGNNYYGVSWIRARLPNSTILTGVIVFMLVGMMLRYALAQVTVDYNKRILTERDRAIALSLHDVRQRAMASDRTAQIRAFRDQIIAEDALDGRGDTVKDTDRNKKLLEILATTPTPVPQGKEEA